MLEACLWQESGLSKQGRLGFGFALVAVLATVAWILLTGDPKGFAEVVQQSKSEGQRSPSLAAVSKEGTLETGPQLVGARRTAHARGALPLPARRGELDLFALPFPFSGRCVANGRSVVGATVQYKGETRTTDENGRFSFPSYGHALRVIVEAEGFGQLIVSSVASKMTLQMQPPAIGRVIVRDSLGRVEAAQVTVFLLPELVRSEKERFLLRDLPIVGKQETDSKGLAFFPNLPTYYWHENGIGLLYCLIEYPDGSQHEDFLIPRKQAVSRGDPRIEWSRDYRRSGSTFSTLRVEQRNEFGNRVPVPSKQVHYRVSSIYFAPWHVDTTDLSGSIMIREWDSKHMQVVVPISSTSQWSSVTDPLIDMGSRRIALIESEEQAIQLLGGSTDESIRFQVQRMTSNSEDPELEPRSSVGVVSLSEWGWQDCQAGGYTKLVSGWVGKDSWVWVRVQPGNWVIASKRLNPTGHTDVRLPELARLSVLAGVGQRFPLGARVWLTNETAKNLPPLILDPRGSNVVQGVVPFGVYRVSLVTTGVEERNLGSLRIDTAKQEYTIEFPQGESTLALSLGTHLLADFSLRLDQQPTPRRTDAMGELAIQGIVGDSILVQLPASPKLSHLELPGRPELVFLGYEARLPFVQESMHLQVPLGSLFFEAHPQDGGKVRVSRRDSAGETGVWIELPETSGGALLARTLPIGRYRLETSFRTLDVEIKPIGRVQVDADDR